MPSERSTFIRLGPSRSSIHVRPPHSESDGETMKTTTRVFESRKLRTRKFFGIPVPVLALLVIAGVVAAAYVSKQLNSSAPQTIQGTALTFKATTDPGLTPS